LEKPLLVQNIFKNLFVEIRNIVGGRFSSYESVLREAKGIALKEMEKQTYKLKASTVIGIDLDYETVGAKSRMLMVTTSGTAIKF